MFIIVRPKSVLVLLTVPGAATAFVGKYAGQTRKVETRRRLRKGTLVRRVAGDQNSRRLWRETVSFRAPAGGLPSIPMTYIFVAARTRADVGER